MRNAPLLNLALVLAIALMTGWLLSIGRALLLPVILAVIVVYVLTSMSQAVKRIPGVGGLPSLMIKLILLVIFSLVFLALVVVLSVTVDELVRVAPTYQKNLENLLASIAVSFEIKELPKWDEIRDATLKKINLQSMLVWVVGGLTSIGSAIFLVVVYAAFLFGEQASFASRLASAFPNARTAATMSTVIAEINRKIGDYLAVKTLINIILAILSYFIMLLFGVDFAIFWAILIGFLNYIPYFGSLLGVVFPVVISIAQFTSISTSLFLAVALTGTQMYVGNVLEPRKIGRYLNLSPLVVLLALSFWTALWGLPGAILAIPLTSMVAIVLSSFEQTRFAAVLLSDRPEKLE